MSHNLPTVAHFRKQYLGLTETFIYNYLSNFRRVRPVVFTETTINLDAFPIKPIYVHAFPKYSLRRFANAFAKRVFKHDLYVEYYLRREEAKLIHAHFGPKGRRLLSVKKNIGLPLVTTFYGVDLSLYHWTYARDYLSQQGFCILWTAISSTEGNRNVYTGST